LEKRYFNGASTVDLRQGVISLTFILHDQRFKNNLWL